MKTIGLLTTAEYVRKNLFEPLKMTESGFYLTELESGRQSVPYAWIDAGVSGRDP